MRGASVTALPGFRSSASGVVNISMDRPAHLHDDPAVAVGQVCGHDIRFLPIQHSTRLRPGTAAGGLDEDEVAGFRLRLLAEGLVYLTIEFVRRIVGDVEALRWLLCTARRRHNGHAQGWRDHAEDSWMSVGRHRPEARFPDSNACHSVIGYKGQP